MGGRVSRFKRGDNPDPKWLENWRKDQKARQEERDKGKSGNSGKAKETPREKHQEN